MKLTQAQIDRLVVSGGIPVTRHQAIKRLPEGRFMLALALALLVLSVVIALNLIGAL